MSDEGLKRTLAELVAIDTTSARPNVRLIDYAEARLTKAGLRCRRQGYVDEAGVEKTNLLAFAGPEGKPELALVGHTDCVPFDPDWKEALTLTERNGMLYGRGACDTKAFIACALHAIEAAKPTKPLLLVLTADEEIGCVGARKLVEAREVEPRFAIVGEPTSLRPIRAHKGYCYAEIEILGKEGHSAYPDTGASAIFRASRFLQLLEAESLSVIRETKDPAFEPPYTTVNVGLISGGKAKNIIPGSCKFVVEWRPIPSEPVERVEELIEGLCIEMKRDDPDFEARINIVREDLGVSTREDSKVVRYLVEQSGNAPATVSFGTEAPHLTRLGAEAVVFGPGDITNAHQTGEFVPVAELVRCREILSRAVAHFCGG